MSANADVILSFYEKAFNGWDLSDLEQYMREDYMQHSPEVADGREGFRAFMEGFISQRPHVDILKVLENDDHVGIFFRCTFEGSDVPIKVMDIYRLEDGMLAEHWDVLQPLPDGDVTTSGRSNF